MSSVDLPGVPSLELHGLIVVIGPNSSGKTQFLQDINDAVCGRNRKLVIATGISYREPPPFEEYFEFLVNQEIVRENAPDTFIKQSLQFGSELGVGTIRKSSLKSQHGQFLRTYKQNYGDLLPVQPFLEFFGPLSGSALFLKDRLTLMDSCPNFDHQTQGPSKTLQVLYRNKLAKQALCAEITKVFKKAVWVDHTRYPHLLLRVFNSERLPSPEDRLEPEIMERFRTIESEGDGLRSYSAICAALLLEQRGLYLIDEPEMCLHPPQASAMGRFIGENASDNTCTITSTHSSHVLRGILEKNPSAQIIRLTLVNSKFRARRLRPDLLLEATSKPRSRSESILEGLLSHAVVLCESEGDRIVYESTYHTFKDQRLDVRFVPSEGTGGFADPLRLYKALNVPSAVIADIDFLAKAGELKKVLTELGTPESEVKTLCNRAGQAITNIRSCISQIDPDAIQGELKKLSQDPIVIEKKEDMKLRGKLTEIVKRLSRLHRLKELGLDAIPENYTTETSSISLRKDVTILLDDLKLHGLFLVPVGELESWLHIPMKGQSREKKTQWAMLAAEKVEDIGERENDVWSFVSSVYGFLQNRLVTLTEDSTTVA